MSESHFPHLEKKGTFEQRPPVNNDDYFWVVVVHMFDCIFKKISREKINSSNFLVDPKMTTKSDLFYDPFADRSDKLEGIDFKFAATTDRDGKNGIGSNGSANEDDSQHEDEQVVV